MNPEELIAAEAIREIERLKRLYNRAVCVAALSCAVLVGAVICIWR